MNSPATRKIILVALAVGVVTFIVGLLIGLYAPARRESNPEPEVIQCSHARGADPTVSERLIHDIDTANIDKHLKKLTELPHIAGRADDDNTLSYVRDEWVRQGYDVEVTPYDVLLSYPDGGHNNSAMLVETNGNVIFQTTSKETPFYPEESHPETVQAYNAYSPSGNPEAELVYVHYGRNVDFVKLTELGVNVSGKIVIARYGYGFRGNKVHQAYLHGAIGVILYTDPADFSKGTLYPDGVWNPDTGIRRGNIVVRKGDQATPGYPANWYTARLTKEEQTEFLPKIPSQPISYGDALHLLREMEGDPVPDAWQGGLNITYRLGGTMKNNIKVRLDVQNHLETVNIYNVFAKLKGTVESDKVVLIGNHRDAWVYGGTDPSSGTATMLEMSRVYAQQVKDGWKPRRSVIFCSWDAEEFGLVGSNEWVEDNVKWLQNRAVAYLNVDLVTGGNFTALIAATPTLKQAVYNAAKKVPDAFQKDKMLYDVWKTTFPDQLNPGYPNVLLPGSGSDFVPFEEDLAIPTANILYAFLITPRGLHAEFYPLYHTLYEGYRHSRLMDPEFGACKTSGSFLLELARDLIDSPVLPFDARDLTKTVHYFVDELARIEGTSFERQNITFDAIRSAADNFTDAAINFHNSLQEISNDNILELRAVNERLMTLEKAFFIPTGLPTRPYYKHVLLAPDQGNYIGGTTFPGLADLLYQIGDDVARWEKVRKHLSVLTFTIQSAAKILMT